MTKVIFHSCVPYYFTIMKLKGVYRGVLTIIDLPITHTQWAAYNTGKSTLAHCFPHLNKDEQEFVRTATAVGMDEKVETQVHIVSRMQVDTNGLSINRF
jgi:hypothetical protein